MISIYNILSSITKTILDVKKGTQFEKVPIYIDKDKLQAFDNEKSACFFVGFNNIAGDIATLETNIQTSIIDITYYPKVNEDVKTLYQLQEVLLPVFARNINVKGEFIDIIETEINTLSDTIGKFLHISLTIEYFDYVYEEQTNKEVIKEITISENEEVIKWEYQN